MIGRSHSLQEGKIDGVLIAYAACLSALKRHPKMLAHTADRVERHEYGADLGHAHVVGGQL